MKEYQELAAMRKSLVERLEKEVEELKNQLKDAEEWLFASIWQLVVRFGSMLWPGN